MTTSRVFFWLGLLAGNLLTHVVSAQTAAPAAAPKPKLSYSLAWGLFRSPDYAGRSKAAAERRAARVQAQKPKTLRFNLQPGPGYEVRRALGGAVQWTEKKPVSKS